MSRSDSQSASGIQSFAGLDFDNDVRLQEVTMRPCLPMLKQYPNLQPETSARNEAPTLLDDIRSPAFPSPSGDGKRAVRLAPGGSEPFVIRLEAGSLRSQQ